MFRAESVVDAANRRLAEELGLSAVELTDVGVHIYRAGDPRTGRIEHEYDHVLVGRVAGDAAIHPDPLEVAEVRWVDPDSVRALVAADPRSCAPWLAGVLAVAESAGVR